MGSILDKDSSQRTDPETALPVTHPFLGIDSYTRTVFLCWDVRLPPSTATVKPTPNKYRGMGRSLLPNVLLDQSELSLPATHPPTTHMKVAIPQLNWQSINITSGSGLDGFVSFSDLLTAVHDSLQTRVRAGEWATFPRELQAVIADAFHLHCKLIGQYRAEERLGKQFDPLNFEEESEWESRREKVNGLRRVDCLGILTEFFGLTLDQESGSKVWKLALARPSS